MNKGSQEALELLNRLKEEGGKCIWCSQDLKPEHYLSDRFCSWDCGQKFFKRRWYEKNRGRVIAAAKEWDAQNKERSRELKKLSQRRNKRPPTPAQKKQKRDYSRQWQRDNSVRLRAKRRARKNKATATGHFTTKQWEFLKALHDFTCLGCRRREPEIRLEADHVVPLALGGGNDISNIQPLCRSCNARKHARFLDFRPW